MLEKTLETFENNSSDNSSLGSLRDDTIKILKQINFQIEYQSRNNTLDHVVRWFQQSPLHWYLVLFVMKYYHLKEELSIHTLVENLNNNVTFEGQKTTTTEYKYINDAIRKGFFKSVVSSVDGRKKNIIPLPQTILSMNKWFINFTSMTKLI